MIVVSVAIYFVGAMAKRNEAMRSNKLQPTNVILESTRIERENHIADRLWDRLCDRIAHRLRYHPGGVQLLATCTAVVV